LENLSGGDSLKTVIGTGKDLGGKNSEMTHNERMREFLPRRSSLQ